MTALVRTTTPSAIDEVGNLKQHLRVDHSVDDGLIALLAEAAVDAVEEYTQRRMQSQTWQYYLDDFPHDRDFIRLPYPPLQSVTSVEYKDPDTGSYATWSSAAYVVDSFSKPARIAWAPDTTQWPVIQDNCINGVKITFVCGYGSGSAVPEGIRNAIRLILGHYYEHREEVIMGVTPIVVPKAAEYLLNPWKVYNFV